jgi:tRNA threonylcarbamoyl adenosine modification protein (Sua5/YciO/YrdC/YwlC family)
MYIFVVMLIKLYNDNPNLREIDKIVSALHDGGIVIYPTDTLYAIGCDALNVRAVEKICNLKGINPEKSNLSIICNDLSIMSEYAKVDTPTFKLMKRNLPGPFTFILTTTSSLPKIYKKKKTVGIRVPDNDIIREIVARLGNPVLSTSVKDENDEIEYTTNPELIHEKWQDFAEIVIDGGIGGIEPSTVVDCTSGEPVIIRQGKGELKF